MPNGPQSSIGSEAEQTHSAEGNLQVYRVLQEVLNFSGAEVGGQPHAPAPSTPRKDAVPIVQEAGWAPGPVWTGGKARPHRDSIPDLQPVVSRYTD